MSVMKNLHDAELIEVNVDGSAKRVRLRFQTGSEGEAHMELQGVLAFRCEDLTLQNVVSRVLQSSKGHFTPESLQRWVQWVTSLSDCDSWLREDRKQAWNDAFQERQFDLVVIEPSAGAQLAVVCQHVVWAAT
jgi:hypothetical protein